MKKLWLFILAFAVASCSYQYIPVKYDPTEVAQEYIGLHERFDRDELTTLMGIDPVHTEWCAAFVNAILEKDGIKNLYDIRHPRPLTARGFLDWGYPVKTSIIQRGDIVIFPRGNVAWQGHVGFYIGTHTESGKWIILGGNQNKEVKYSLFSPTRSIGIRRAIVPE